MDGGRGEGVADKVECTGERKRGRKFREPQRWKKKYPSPTEVLNKMRSGESASARRALFVPKTRADRGLRCCQSAVHLCAATAAAEVSGIGVTGARRSRDAGRKRRKRAALRGAKVRAKEDLSPLRAFAIRLTASLVASTKSAWRRAQRGPQRR